MVLLRKPDGNMAGWGSSWLAQCFLYLVSKFSESRTKYDMPHLHSLVHGLEPDPVNCTWPQIKFSLPDRS